MSEKKGILQRNGNSEMANKFVLWRNVLLVSFLTIMFLFVSVMAEKMCNRMPLLFEMGDTACYEDNCSLHIVESIPDNLTFPPEEISHMSTYEGLLQLIEEATESIDIASFYWSMLGEDVPFSDSSAWQGENLFKALLEAGQKRNIKIRIVINKPTKYLHDYDTKHLEKYANAEVRYLDFKKLMGGGILHTKVWIVDRCHFYVGSANLDWRSFTQVKELGALVQKCCCITADLMKLFSVYWVLGKADSVPSKWESSYSTKINGLTPMTISVKNMLYDVYFSSSPKPFCPKGRTVDIDAILDVINSAEKFIYIAVMDYYPTITYVFPKVYWPLIDDALRNASFARNVKVRFMASKWYHTRKDMFYYLNSLNVVENLAIEIKVFEVPFYTEEQRKIPFSRVNHNKYMVTEKIAYIGTSNWSGEYFVYTGGVGFIIQPKEKGKDGEEQDVRQQLEKTFLRDWNSEFAKPLSDILKNN